MRMFFVTLVLVGIVLLFRFLSGEQERIKTFLRIYYKSKNKSPEASERDLLEIVVEEHIPPGRAVQLRKIGITGKQYLDGVFGKEPIDIENLISLMIRVEFSEKYKIENLKQIEDRIIEGKPSKEEELMQKIKKYHKKYLDRSA